MAALKLGGHRLRPISAQIVDARELRRRNLFQGACMTAPVLTDSDDGHRNPVWRLHAFAGGDDRRPGLWARFRARRHFNPAARPGPKRALGARHQTSKAAIAILRRSASSIRRGRSKSSVLPASMASARAFARSIRAIVAGPTTGTSKRISCPGLL